MNNETKITIGVAAVLLVVVVGVLGFSLSALRGSLASIENSIELAAKTLEKLDRLNLPDSPALGSMTGPSIPFNHVTFADAGFYHSRVPMRIGTNTPCSLQNPIGTSTVWLSVVSTTTSSNAKNWTFSTSTAQTATSTVLGNATTNANNKTAFAFSTGGVGVQSATTTRLGTVGTNEWINLNVYGTSLNTATDYGGHCTFELQEL